MKNWNTPELIDVNINETANGWDLPWTEEKDEVLSAVSHFFGGGDVYCPGAAQDNNGGNQTGKGGDENTSGTNESSLS